MPHNKQLALQSNGSRKPRKRLGRRSLLTPALQKRICDLLAKGNTIVATMAHCGLSESVYFDWAEQHQQFLQATSRARGKARVRHVKILTDAAKTDWRASAWLLSHCWPQEYSETNRTELAVAAGVIILPPKSEGAE